MIRLQSVKKTYNKNKPNEIKAVDNISLELPDNGMVALLGKSGSGKTTLLNVMSGLDKYDRGSISIKGHNIERYKTGLWDKLRSREIGYVFQNYCLIENRSVYDNLAISLKLAGFKEKSIIDERIDYALSLVGMDKYKKRKPNTLSGGQQQRVAIARAIVKGPSIIIADEPTGNLDSDNTFEVMDILKSISLERLVVLVTHEEAIADFFADRIIRLRDGVIVEDIENLSDKDLSIINNRNIFLKDLPYSKNFDTDNFSIRFNGDSNKKYDIHIIEKGGRIFINARDSEVPVILLDDSSEIRVLEDNISVKSKGTHKTKEIKLSALAPSVNQNRYNIKDFFYSIFDVLKNYLKMPKNKKRINKAILFVFSIAILISIFYIYSNLNFNEDSYTYNRDTVLVSARYYLRYFDIIALVEEPSVDCIVLTGGKFAFKPFHNYSFPFEFNIKCDIYPIAHMPENRTIIYGRDTINENEIIIDIKTAKRIIKELDSAGVRKAESILNENITYGDSAFTIVGVIDGGFDGGFVQEENFEFITVTYAENVELHQYKVLLNDKEGFINAIQNSQYFYEDEYQRLKDSFYSKRKFQLPFNVGLSAVCLFIMIIITSQTTRARMINQIKEIGTYRCIGVRRFNILKDYLLETFFLLCSSALLGIVIAGGALHLLSAQLQRVNPQYVFDIVQPLLAFGLVFVLSILINVYIVMRVLWHTPAEIMAKYDI